MEFMQREATLPRVILSAAKDLGGGDNAPSPRSFAALRMTGGRLHA